jgi:uncharacterized protein
MKLFVACLFGVGFMVVAGLPGSAGQPSFDCAKAEGAVEEMICADSLLAALDVEMNAVWNRVMELAGKTPDLKRIQAEQRGWIKGRNDCWKDERLAACVQTSYRLRIAELQARWRLVPGDGPHFLACNENPADEVVATFFSTEPPCVILERGDQSVFAARQPSGSGVRYEGGNVVFWMKGDEARLAWGWKAAESPCRLRRSEN